MSLVTTSEFNAIRDAMITSVNGGTAMEAAWTAAVAGKDAEKLAHLAGLKLAIVKQVLAAVKVAAISGPEVVRVGAFYAQRLAAGDSALAAWAATKAAFPGFTDATLEAHKAEALAHASDHPAGYRRV